MCTKKINCILYTKKSLMVKMCTNKIHVSSHVTWHVVGELLLPVTKWFFLTNVKFNGHTCTNVKVGWQYVYKKEFNGTFCTILIVYYSYKSFF